MKRLVIAMTMAIATYGQVSVSPSIAAVPEGGTIAFSANVPVVWSLLPGSAGTLAVVSPTAVSYVAPQVVLPQGTAGGCQTGPNDSVWNTKVEKLPVEGRSAAWIAAMSAKGLSVQVDFGLNVVEAATQMQEEVFHYAGPNNGAYPRMEGAIGKRQAGAYQTDISTGSTDRHAMYVDPRGCVFYELYKQYPAPRTGLPYCGVGQTCTATSGVSYLWSSYTLPVLSTQASNLLYEPLLLRLAEIKQGVIPHALSFTESQYNLHAMSYWPANSVLGCKSCSGPPYGARFRLKASYDISGFSPSAQVVLQALKDYGMFLSDASIGGATLYADTDTTQDPGIIKAFAEIAAKNITMGQFEVVDETSLMVSASSSEVNPANGYEVPATYAVLEAVPVNGGGPGVKVPIALGAGLPGTSAPTLSIVAGTPSYQLAGWVGARVNQALAWKLVSGVGTVTSAGVYTPPATVTAPAAARLSVSPVASPGLAALVDVTVLPASSDGCIRIDVGSSVPTTSAGGSKKWLADTGYESAVDKTASDYPAWADKSNADAGVYQTYRYVHGNDLTYSLGVPNGNYKVRMLFGAPFNGLKCPAPPAACTYDPKAAASPWGPYNLVVNGKVVAHNYDFGIKTGHLMGVGTDAVVPATVTQNQLTVSVRGYRPDELPGLPVVLPVLEGLEIAPDGGTTPYVAIDSQQQKAVAAGGTLQLYAVGWYMDNAVAWNIVSGPGTVGPTGVYTAPGVVPPAGQTVIVQAVSKARMRAAATVTLTVTGPS